MLRVSGLPTLLALLVAAILTPTGAYGQHPGHPTVQPTPEERAAAEQLLAQVRAALGRYADRGAAEAAGYRQSGPWRFVTWGPAHFANPRYLRDGRLLDPERPEGLVYLRLEDGRDVLLGAFFVAPRGQGPRPGGPLTEWHTHDCHTTDGRRLRSEGGACPPGTVFRPARVEMLHVWTFDNPDGPFAHALTRRAIRAAVEAARR
jgi:hypothetical protein